MWFFLAFRNLFRNIRRTIAVLCTIALGAGALLTFESFIKGVLDQYREDTIHAHYGYGQVNTAGYRDKVFSDPTQHWIGNGEQVEEFLMQVPGVVNVFPRASLSAILKSQNVTVSGMGQGVDSEREADFFHSLNVEEGETLRDQYNGILLGRGLADALDVHPGDTVSVYATSSKGVINNDKFVVTGIFHTGLADFDKRTFRIQLPNAQKLLKTNKVELISLGLRSLSDWDNVAAAVQKEYTDLEATSFDVLDEVYYKHSVDWLNAQFRVVQGIILAIVLFGIFNVLSSSIFERKQEIGNLRANGESVFEVMRLIMAEGAFLAVFGSLLGMGGAFFVIEVFLHKGIIMPPGPGMTKQFFALFSFSSSMVSSILFFSSSVAIIASFLACIRVAKMAIAKSLRSY